MSVGVFGGTFNPIHWGHLRAAEEVTEELALDRMLFVPSASPPHKASGDIASIELSNQSAALRRPAAGEDLLFHSNRFRATSMREVELAPDSRYTDRAPTPLRGIFVHRSADVRDAPHRSRTPLRQICRGKPEVPRGNGS